jgi:hypothetical protein
MVCKGWSLWSRALFELGLMLLKGEGGRKSPARGRQLIERAGASGEVDALRVLAVGLERGDCGFKESPAKNPV